MLVTDKALQDPSKVVRVMNRANRAIFLINGVAAKLREEPTSKPSHSLMVVSNRRAWVLARLNGGRMPAAVTDELVSMDTELPKGVLKAAKEEIQANKARFEAAAAALRRDEAESSLADSLSEELGLDLPAVSGPGGAAAEAESKKPARKPRSKRAAKKGEPAPRSGGGDEESDVAAELGLGGDDFGV